LRATLSNSSGQRKCKSNSAQIGLPQTVKIASLKNSSAVGLTMDIDKADSQELKELQFKSPLVSGGKKPLETSTLLECLKVCLHP
jgi:hypothetical protein